MRIGAMGAGPGEPMAKRNGTNEVRSFMEGLPSLVNGERLKLAPEWRKLSALECR